MVAIVGQCNVDCIVGDTSAFTRVVYSPAIPKLSTGCLRSPHPRASQFTLPFSCIAQLFLPRQCCSFFNLSSIIEFLISIAACSWDIPHLYGLGYDSHRRANGAVFADTYLSPRTYAPECTRIAIVSERSTCEARPARSPASATDAFCGLPVHLVSTLSYDPCL
jgi:hypothetical protein